LIHHLQHSFNELRWLGVHPFTLRKLILPNEYLREPIIPVAAEPKMVAQ
jgi:hypothetical protein